MILKPVVVLALALLVPVLCEDSVNRCELRDQLKENLGNLLVLDSQLATVVCQVESFVQKLLNDPSIGSGSDVDRLIQCLQNCISVTNGVEPNVDAECLSNVFLQIQLYASEECKDASLLQTFFQDCPVSGSA
ncbi:hypothetical protein NQD34_001783 [Periophthalmus magnuspinnatus]|nr:hypothetical protein NQD34_001783 [Periophthalmus magnuspinnatus]